MKQSRRKFLTNTAIFGGGALLGLKPLQGGQKSVVAQWAEEARQTHVIIGREINFSTGLVKVFINGEPVLARAGKSDIGTVFDLNVGDTINIDFDHLAENERPEIEKIWFGNS